MISINQINTRLNLEYWWNRDFKYDFTKYFIQPLNWVETKYHVKQLSTASYISIIYQKYLLCYIRIMIFPKISILNSFIYFKISYEKQVLSKSSHHFKQWITTIVKMFYVSLSISVNIYLLDYRHSVKYNKNI